MQCSRIIYTFFCLILFTGILYSQDQASLYPVQISQFYNCYPIINPASAGTYSDYDAALGSQQLLGAFKEIATYYFNANMRILNNNGSKNAPYSAIGALVYNDREGKYINRPRFYFTYVWHGHISRDVSVSGGFHIGGASYSTRPTENSPGGSKTAVDGSVGMQVYNKKFQTGISYNQIFRSILDPIEDEYPLLPYFNFMASTYFEINENTNFKPDFLIRLPTNGEKYSISANARFLYQNKLSAGMGLYNSTHIVGAFELRNLLDAEKGLNISLTYGYPIKGQGVMTHFAEIGLSFCMDKSWYK